MRARRELAVLLPLLRSRGGLWHATGPEGIRKIFEACAIFWNDGERIPSNFCKSAGNLLRAVCLFDFCLPADDKLMAVAQHVLRFTHFHDKERGAAFPGVWVCIDRGELPLPVIGQRSSEFRKVHAAGNMRPNWIPNAECWYQGDILLNAWTGFLVFDYPGGDLVPQWVEKGASALAEILRLLDKRDADATARKPSPGALNLTEILHDARSREKDRGKA